MQNYSYELLKEMCSVIAPVGNEEPLKDFILEYISKNQHNWKVQPTVLVSDELHENIILIFGTPKTAIFAHLDSIGFIVKYGKEIIKIGGPVVEDGTRLIGKDSKGLVKAILRYNVEEDLITYEAEREIDRGTELVFEADFRETDSSVQCCYLDNRLGCWTALKVAETLENGAIVFSTYEEHGGGAVRFLAKKLYENYGVRKALIADITWVTEGVEHGKGVAISIRDRGIPRRKFVNSIIDLAKQSGIPYQLEVESGGGSDGHELQKSPYPFEWCFIGAAESNVHSPNELVDKKDIESMIDLYKYLMINL